MRRWSSILILCLLSACQEDPVLTTGQQDLSQPQPQTTSAPQVQATPTPMATPVLGTSIGGVVRDSVSGQLVSQATVRLDARSTLTDQTGYYLFLEPGKGEGKLIVEREGYQPFTQTVQIGDSKRVVDIQIVPANAPTATPQTPVVLQPDGSASVAPSASPAASPTPDSTPAPTATPGNGATPSPTASPAYDPALDEVAQSEVLVKNHPNGVELTFSLQKSNGLPVNWEWGQITVQYVISGTDGKPIANGVTVINSFGDKFVTNSAVSPLPNQVKAVYTLTLPDGRKISADTTVQVF